MHKIHHKRKLDRRQNKPITFRERVAEKFEELLLWFRLLARILASLSAVVSLLMFADLALPARSDIVLVSKKESSESPRSFGYTYTLRVSGNDIVESINVSEGFYDTTQKGDFLRIRHSPIWGSVQKVELLRNDRTIITESIRQVTESIGIAAFGLLPLMVFLKRKDFLNFWFLLLISIIATAYILLGYLVFRHLMKTSLSA